MLNPKRFKDEGSDTSAAAQTRSMNPKRSFIMSRMGLNPILDIIFKDEGSDCYSDTKHAEPKKI
jgi:hypothetical protein